MAQTSMPQTTTLFDGTQQRIAEARVKVDAIDAADEVKRVGHRNLNRLDRASRHDLSIASRKVEEFHASLDAGEIPIYD